MLLVRTGWTCVLLLALPVSLPAQSLSAEDHAEIQQLYARVTHAFDSAADRGEAFAGAFTPDGLFVDVDGNTYKGRESLAALAVKVSQGNPAGMATEFVYNHLIEPAPTGAVSKTYVVVTRKPVAGQPVTAIAAGQYHDSLVRTPAGWRISRREFVRTPAAPPAVGR